MSKENSFLHPDFAFPETVGANARMELRKALEVRDSERAFKAMLQICRATELRSSDAVDSNVGLIDSVIPNLSQPYRALADLYKAGVVTSKWSSNRWVYDNRTLPEGEVPNSMELWNTSLFAEATVKAVENAMALSPEEMARPIKDITGILKETKDAEKAGFTIGDFMYMKSLKSLGSFCEEASSTKMLPFGEEIVETPVSPSAEAGLLAERTAGRWLDSLPADASVWRVAIAMDGCLSLVRDSDKTPWLERLADKYKDNDAWLAIVVQMYRNRASGEPAFYEFQDPESKKEQSDRHYYLLLSEGIRRYPKSPFVAEASNILSELTTESISLSFSQQYLPEKEIKMTIRDNNLRKGYLLVMSLPKMDINAEKLEEREIVKAGHLVKAIPFSSSKEIPFSDSIPISLGSLEPGDYALIPSRTSGIAGCLEDRSRNSAEVFRVSALSMIIERNYNGMPCAYVVNGEDGSPVKDANVTVYSRKDWRTYIKTATYRTDNEGKALLSALPDNAYRLVAEHGNNRILYDIWGSHVRDNGRKQVKGEFFLDRAIAKPGEEVEFAGVTYSVDGGNIAIVSDKEFKVVLRNASGREVDSLKVVSDAAGRFSGTFTLPNEGMLGWWQLHLVRPGQGTIGSVSLRVEEYKTPTFRVTLTTDSASIKAGEPVRISGMAQTFSGMPVGKARVEIDIKEMPRRFWWWWHPSDYAPYHTVLTTDAEGRFEILLPTARLKGTPLENSAFELTAAVTNPAGETRSGEIAFAIGDGESVAPQIPDRVEVTGEKITLNVPVYNMMGNPQRREVEYEVFTVNEGKAATPLLKGLFTSPLLEISSSLLPSDSYILVFRLPDNKEARETTVNMVVWRQNDSCPPEDTPLWVPLTSVQPSEGMRNVSVIVGAVPDNQHILCEITDGKKIVERRWLNPLGRNVTVEAPVPADTARVYVKFATVGNLKPYSSTVTVMPVEESRKLDVVVCTFRDRLTAGDREKWQFKFTAGNLPAKVEAFAVMSDKALNSLQPFRWSWNPRWNLNYFCPVELNQYNPGSDWLSAEYSHRKYMRVNKFSEPDWKYSDIYGLRIRGSRIINRSMVVDECYGATEAVMADSYNLTSSMEAPRMMMKSAAVATAGAIKEEVDDWADMELAESEVEGDAGNGTAPDSDYADIQLRAAEMPVAFFRSSLRSDSIGVVTVDFNVPEFNTTWQFQLLGYDDRLQTASVCLDAVAAKKVMVQLNSPRFVRTGDHIVLSAMAYNNSPEVLPLGGRLEVVDLQSGKILEGKTFKPVNTEAAGSRLLTMEFSVPSDAYSLALRAYALSGNNSDGEQIGLAVLPSSSPVVESVPFYLSPSDKTFELTLPKIDKNAQVTLLYCDNPIWYCLTALPELVDEPGEWLTSLLRAYYGNSIGLGILDRYPAAREGLTSMFEDGSNGKSDILDSPLEKNGSLKIVASDATPWVNSAQAETARMHSLEALLDSVKSRRVLTELAGKIVALKNSDGGMAWFDKGPSSMWTTGQTLLHLGMLDRFGYLPADSELRKLIAPAARWYETKLVDDWKKTYRGETSRILTSMVNYLYIKSLFHEKGIFGKESADFSRLTSESLRLIEEDWRSFDIYTKATAATLLFDRGRTDTAREILRSLKEFATVTTQKGMWFDTLRGGIFSPWNKLITTAQVLEAWHRIEPSAPEVDSMRQWLLLQRQAEDWGNLSHGAELVQAVLESGTDWMQSTEVPDIRLNGKRVVNPEAFPKFGEAVITLSVKKASGGRLRIERSGQSPAWGGVLSQYVAPISEIRSVATEDVAIEKEIFLLDESGSLVTGKRATGKDGAQLKVGDLVRVQLTVTTDRDLEFVAITDERGACLEPVESLSGLTAIDGRMMYREVRNTQTNFFLYFLPKGRYQFSYDCRLSQEGEFAAGIATLQSQYAPTLTGHSAGQQLSVVR